MEMLASHLHSHPHIIHKYLRVFFGDDIYVRSGMADKQSLRKTNAILSEAHFREFIPSE